MKGNVMFIELTLEKNDKIIVNLSAIESLGKDSQGNGIVTMPKEGSVLATYHRVISPKYPKLRAILLKYPKIGGFDM